MQKRSIPYRIGRAVTRLCILSSVALAALKLSGLCLFSWWWVAAPYALPSAMLLGLCVVYYLIVRGYR